MKYVFVVMIILTATALGILLGTGIFDDFGLIIGIFIIFPIIYIFGIIFLGRGRKEKPIDKNEKNNRFSKWE
ncbi:MAG: hypothetical protein M0R05_01825 [Bacilli bacterium]|nr:hypothetical protein [Bacilli bacterium]MDD4076362.1 hypothetical protein [Bacilli bacterium]MDD4388678.1 hypothetical protein [Bacilli bacterium]